MSEKWIMTQNGAVKKSEINMILLQDSEESEEKKNIILLTKDNLSLLMYNDVDNAYLGSIIIDNLIREFDETHIPQIDLKKRQEELEKQQEEKSKIVENKKIESPSKSDEDVE